MALLKLMLTLTIVISSFDVARALPADFSGSYEILDQRLLAYTFGHPYALQDGSLVTNASLDLSRTFCRAGQSTFDDYEGSVKVSFSRAVDGSEHAILKTVPSSAAANPTTIECIATHGFTGVIDVEIALGRIMVVN